MLEKLSFDAKRYNLKVIAGDFNVWAEEWGSKCKGTNTARNIPVPEYGTYQESTWSTVC